MNESINLPKLIAKMAAEAGCDPAEARRFLHHLFSLVEESLLQGELVNIKGVGEFHPGEDPSSPVKFRPDDTLAAIANEPFAAFSPTELNDGVTPEMLGEQPQQASESPAAEVPESAHVVPQPAPAAAEIATAIPETATAAPEPEPQEALVQQETTEVEEPAPKEEPQPEESMPEASAVENDQEQPAHPAPSYEPVDEQEYYEPEPQIVYVEKKGVNVLWLLIGILAGLVLGLVGGYFAGKYMSQYTIGSDLAVEPVESVSLFSEEESTGTDDEPAVRETTVADGAAAETQSSVSATSVDAQERPASPAVAEPVYDTVSRTRYLTTMARDHYGKKAYWVFIYQANPQLKDPNKIAPGTRVKIPARESFAESTEQATDEKAKKILNELSRRYNL